MKQRVIVLLMAVTALSWLMTSECKAQKLTEVSASFGNSDGNGVPNWYWDVNGDGKLDANDRTVLGSWNPSYTFGFNLGADWNGFDFMAAFQGAAGVKGYVSREGVGYVNGDASKPTTLWLNHWTPNNPDADTPRLIQGMEGWSMPTTASESGDPTGWLYTS